MKWVPLITGLLLIVNISAISKEKNNTDSIIYNIDAFNYEKALKLIHAELMVNPTSVTLYQLKGKVLRSQYQYYQALEAFLKGFSLNYDNNTLLLEMQVPIK